MKFGLLGYETQNLGDEIQSLAARRFLPRVDHVLPRENLDAPPPAPLALLLNGWFMHRPRHWPPHDDVRVLPISMHLNSAPASRWRRWQRTPASLLLSGAGLAWFRRQGAVGARDRPTLERLQARGVDSYLSYCLTLTLPANPAPRCAEVIACDLDPGSLAALRARTRSPIALATHDDTATRGHEARMQRATALLQRYASARAVVTTRLHCALPCLALGTPVLYLASPIDTDRQQPALELAHHATPEAFAAGRVDFDADAPPANPDTFRPHAAALAARCEAFVAAMAQAAP